MEQEKIDNILFAISQPVCDDLCLFVSQGKEKEALDILLQQEGHWLPIEDAKEFIQYIREVKEKKNGRTQNSN